MMPTAQDRNDDTDGPTRRLSAATRRHRMVRHFTTSSTIHHVPIEPIKAPSVDKKSVMCGLAAGVCQAALFSPYDRALYLSLTNRRPFLSMENFRNPFNGLSQSIGGRALSSGVYFPLEQFFFRYFHPDLDTNNTQHQHGNNSKLRNFAAGTTAGALNAMILNPLSAIKYKTWGRVYNRGMMEEARSMLQKGGSGVFYKGLASTLMRDVTFGGLYTFTRLQIQWSCSLPRENQWMANLFAAALATIVSGPFNLARNVQYFSKSSQTAPTTYEVLVELAHETRDLQSYRQKLLHLQKRLRIGWGTARVATGMAFGHYCYDGLHGLVHDESFWKLK